MSEEGKERPVAFASRTKLCTDRRGGLSYHRKRFRAYLYRRKFLLLMDHKPVTTIFGPKTGLPVVAAARLQRWALVLSAFQYDVKFRETEEHRNVMGCPDCL